MSKIAAAAAAKPDKPAETNEITQAIAEVKAPISPLLASEWKARESGVFFNTHEVVPAAGTPIANLARRDFWSNVSQKLRPGDTIIAFPRDGAWYAELIVWDAGQNWADVTPKAVLERPEFEPVAGVESQFVIARDPIDGIIVRRRDTGTKLKGNFANHEDARRWIIDQQNALRR